MILLEKEETLEMSKGQEYIKVAPSKYNHKEAKKLYVIPLTTLSVMNDNICILVFTILQFEIAQVFQKNVQDDDTIAILTPYKVQKCVLDELQSGMVRPSTTVHTINESQGDNFFHDKRTADSNIHGACRYSTSLVI